VTLPINSEQARLLHSIFTLSIEREHRTTRAVIEAIPLNAGDYRPDSVSKTAMELAWHIAADLAKWYEDVFQGVFPRLQQLSPEQLTKSIDFRGMYERPAVMYLQSALSHSIHHRGQLSTYLRPMGAKVPAIYGESYDSAEAKKAAK
jgi:uncharacterized damage-inducible protein DinB